MLTGMIVEAGRDPSTFRIAYRVTLPIIAEPPPGERMPFRGSVDQFPEDLASLAEAGVDEGPFRRGLPQRRQNCRHVYQMGGAITRLLAISVPWNPSIYPTSNIMIGVLPGRA